MRPLRSTVCFLRYALAVTLGLLLLTGDAFALQDRSREEVIVDFDRLERVVVDGNTVTLLVNAQIRQGDTFLRADRMRDEGSNIRLFTGNVRIIERGDTVLADVVRFNSNTKIGEASGTVFMTDGAVSLNANAATYYSDEKRTEFESEVQYADSLTLLSARSGIYWSEDSRADFKGDVRLRQSDLYVEADSVRYSREDELFVAGGNVFVDRIENETGESDPSTWVSASGDILGFSTSNSRSLLFGDSITHAGKIDSSHVAGHVFLLRTSEGDSGLDSLMVGAQSMYMSRSASGDTVIATDSVSVVERDFSVSGDSLVYVRVATDDQERFQSRMFGSPVAWVNDSQIDADSLTVWGFTGAIDSLLASGKVFVASRDTTVGRIQQLKGRTLRAQFEGDTLRTMSVSPNAEALYYIEPDPGSPIVAVLSTADRIEFAFDAGSIMDVHAFSGIEGTLYRGELVDQADDLIGFNWTPERRPDKLNMLMELARRQNARAERKDSGSVDPRGSTTEN